MTKFSKEEIISIQKKMIRLINKQSTGEKHCSLNNAKLKEIENIEKN